MVTPAHVIVQVKLGVHKLTGEHVAVKNFKKADVRSEVSCLSSVCTLHVHLSTAHPNVRVL